jgi:hypothetical protein
MAGPQQLSYSELNAELVRRFSDLGPGYGRLKDMWEGEEPGPHIVYGDLLVPYVTALLESGTGSPLLESVFSFLEELLQNEDAQVRDLVGASVLEPLNQPPALRQQARRHMRPMTLALSEQVEEAWGS